MAEDVDTDDLRGEPFRIKRFPRPVIESLGEAGFELRAGNESHGLDEVNIGGVFVDMSAGSTLEFRDNRMTTVVLTVAPDNKMIAYIDTEEGGLYA